MRSRRLSGGANPAHDAVEAADVAQADMLRRVDRQPSRIGTAGRAPDVLRDWHGLMQEESRGAPPPRHHGLAAGAGHRMRLRWLPHAGTDGWRRLRVLLTRRKVRARWNAVICSKPGNEPELRSQNSARRRRASDFLGTHLGTSVSQFSPPFFRPSPSPSEKLAAPAVDSCLKQTK